MTRTERYIKEARECDATIVVKEIADKVKKLENELRNVKNAFRRTCIIQEINGLINDRNLIEEMFIG